MQTSTTVTDTAAVLAAVRRRYVARRARVTERVAELIVEFAFPPREARP